MNDDQEFGDGFDYHEVGKEPDPAEQNHKDDIVVNIALLLYIHYYLRSDISNHVEACKIEHSTNSINDSPFIIGHVVFCKYVE